MFQLNLKNRKSIYEQIVDGCKEMIVKGEAKPGEKLPSVRDMSAKLTVNPNTIQKAYAKLEADGWIYMVPGRGAFVSETRKDADEKQLNDIYAQLQELISQLVYLGEGREEIQSRIAKMVQERRGADD